MSPSPTTTDVMTESNTAHRLRMAIAAAEPALRGVPEPASTVRPAPGKWSPREIVGHLIDSASNNHQRFVRAAFQPDLVFVGYQQDEWVRLQRYEDAPWPDLITLWAAFNRHLGRVMSAVPAAVRTKVHARHNLDEIAFRAPPSPGEATLEYFMADYVDHLEHHLRQILGAHWRPAG